MTDRPKCIECKTASAEKNHHKEGFFFERCTKCRKAKYGIYYGKAKYKYRSLIEKEKCENCSFFPTHKCQLDIDHIDGNKKNNSISNLMVLCANCHRL